MGGGFVIVNSRSPFLTLVLRSLFGKGEGTGYDISSMNSEEYQSTYLRLLVCLTKKKRTAAREMLGGKSLRGFFQTQKNKEHSVKAASFPHTQKLPTYRIVHTQKNSSHFLSFPTIECITKNVRAPPFSPNPIPAK